MDKAQLRQRFRGVPVPESSSIGVAGSLFQFLSARLPGTVATYRALPDEVDVWALVDRLPGWRWVLPRIEDDNELTWREARTVLESHRWGIDQPVESAPTVRRHEIDHVLVPGLVFDRSGRRLGRGKGFYDREISDLRSDAVTIGVTLESRIVERVPTESHDRLVDYVATERGVMETMR